MANPTRMKQLLEKILAMFPQADPDHELYDDEINGCEAVDFIGHIVPLIKTCLEEPAPVDRSAILLSALETALPLLEASYLDHDSTPNGKAVFEGLEQVREAVASVKTSEYECYDCGQTFMKSSSFDGECPLCGKRNYALLGAPQDPIVVTIGIRQLVEDEALDHDDRAENIQGTYEVLVPGNVSYPVAASIALDEIANTVAIACLEDFEITTYIGGEEVVQSDDDGYTHNDEALGFSKVSDELPIVDASEVTVYLNIMDDSGNVVDNTTSTLTIDQVSDIIDHAAQLVLVARDKDGDWSGLVSRDVPGILSELEEALVTADVISALTPEEVCPARDVSDCSREVGCENCISTPTTKTPDFAEFLVAKGYDASDLDELVYETHSSCGGPTGVSAINNGGIEEQVAYMLGMGVTTRHIANVLGCDVDWEDALNGE